MEIVEFTVGNPEWFWKIFSVIILASVVGVIIMAIVMSISKGGLEIFFVGMFFALTLVLIWVLVGGLTSGYMEEEEKERVASEVSEVVGFEVGVSDVELILDEKPMRGIYYVRDGNTLIIEENQ